MTHSSMWYDPLMCITLRNLQNGEAWDSPVFGAEDDDDEPIQPMGDAPDLDQQV